MLSRVEFNRGCQEFLSHQNEDTKNPGPHQYAAGWQWKTYPVKQLSPLALLIHEIWSKV